MEPTSALIAIENWFKNRCNGDWEHHFGITIQTTDNPGWLFTFDELSLNADALAEIIGNMLREYSAQVTTDGTMVRVFAPSFEGVISAAATLIHATSHK